MSDNINYTTVADTDGNTVDVFENEISLFLQEYIDERRIDDMRKEPQSRWNAALIYINKALFGTNKDKLIIDSRVSNAYNIDLISSICDVYITLCYEYDKEISIIGFSKLTGINQDTFYSWGNNETQVASGASEIYKKLNAEREESLSNKLISGGSNPMKILPALNRHYGWNMGQPRGADGTARISVSREEIEARAHTVDLLPESADELPD
ncbi:hypothetical protein [Lacrimispora xylanisolvens]|uniref:hypothetical protein n=1 Tax=Lacrimispora xylanisolvens TaxID=384636 RepID=UPI0024028DDD